jgi:hypothetical protein
MEIMRIVRLTWVRVSYLKYWIMYKMGLRMQRNGRLLSILKKTIKIT